MAKPMTFLAVHIVEEFWVPPVQQMQITDLGHQFYQLNIRFAFKDEADIPKVPALCEKHQRPFEMIETSFFIARHTVISTPNQGIENWREHLFVGMSRNPRCAADYYQIPTNRVIELGTQVEI